MMNANTVIPTVEPLMYQISPREDLDVGENEE